MGYDMEKTTHEEITTNVTSSGEGGYHVKPTKLVIHTEASDDDDKDSNMNDIAGLLALMQGNKNMDLPGLMALCRERGYDRTFGGEGMFMFVFLLLFLFAGGGWNNLGARNQAAFAEMAGNNCQSIIGLHDRITAAQTASTNGFFALDTKLCSSIAEVMAAVRNQGDRNYEATRNVNDTVRDCCCTMGRNLDAIACKIDGVAAEVRLMQERTTNNLQSMECRLSGQIRENANAMALGFERQSNLINEKFTELELERLRRENCELKSTIQGNAIADAAVARLQTFAINHYTPTKTATPAA